MELTYSEEQQAIQKQARDFFTREFPLTAVRQAWTARGGFPPESWRRIAELGWLGALLPEAHGGLGLGVTSLGRILEEMGRGLLPGPYLANILGAQAILLAGNPAQQAARLPAIAAGKERVALARSLEGNRFDRLGGRFYADAKGDAFLLFGEKLAVLGAAEADWLVLPAVLGLPEQLEDGLIWFLIERNRPGVHVQPLETLEGGWRQAHVRLDGVKAAAGDRLAQGDGARVLAQVETLSDVALAFDALGGAQRVLEMTVEYARLRTAFGQPIGAYQAVKHKCADMLFAVENLRSIVTWAAWVLDAPLAEAGVSPRLAAAMARATAIESYDLTIRHGTQSHGAIAVTAEHDLPLFAKRAKTLALAFGGLGHYHETILRESGYATGTEHLNRSGTERPKPAGR